MGEIILNERAWIEDALTNHTLGNKPYETLGRLARYYFADGYKKTHIGRMLEDFLLRCDPTVNLVQWQNVIDDCVKRCDKHKLVDIAGIVITQNELNALIEMESVLEKRLLFTLLCLAKYGNAVNPKNNGWVNRDQKEIFALSNVTLSLSRRALLLNDLWQSGYISYSKVIDNVNVRVEIVDDASEPVILISDFRNLGNQLMYYLGDKSYMPCQICNLMIKRHSNRQKYCKFCAVEIDNAA